MTKKKKKNSGPLRPRLPVYRIKPEQTHRSEKTDSALIRRRSHQEVKEILKDTPAD